MNKRTALVLLTTGLAACSNRTGLSDAQPAALAVATALVSSATLADTFEAGGVVQARTTAAIASRILAPVREVRVSPGDRVRAGDTLVVLDGGPLAAQARGARSAISAAERAVDAAVADQQTAEAGLSLARVTHQRISALHDRHSATAQELDMAVSALRGAEARLAGATAHAAAAAFQLAGARQASEASDVTATFATLTAPFAGVIVQKMVEPGNIASPGTPLLRLEDTAGFRLEVRVDQSRATSIALGSVVDVRLDGPANAPRSLAGTVREFSRSVDAGAHTVLVKIDLPVADGVRSGMFGRAQFTSGERHALLLPGTALVTRGQLTSVFVVDNGVARLRLVNLRGAEVLAGVIEGETVVLRPPPSLSDGRRVVSGGR